METCCKIYEKINEKILSSAIDKSIYGGYTVYAVHIQFRRMK